MKQKPMRAFMAVAVEAIELAFDSPRLSATRRKQLAQVHVLLSDLLRKEGRL